MDRPCRLLAVFAHPDDETCRAGGTLARYAAEGVEVTVVSATRGERGVCGECGDWPKLTVEELVRVRANEFHRATRALGIARALVWDYPDGGLSDCPSRALVTELAQLILSLRPQVLLTWHVRPSGQGEDHATIGRLATLATQVAAGCCVPGLPAAPSAYRVPRLYYLPSVGGPQASLHGRRVVRIDVRRHLEAKAAALRAYRSQWCCAQQVLAQLDEPTAATELFVRAWPRAGEPEDDLFAGVR